MMDTWHKTVDGPLAEARRDSSLALWYKAGEGWTASATRPNGEGVTLASPAKSRGRWGVLYSPALTMGGHYTAVADLEDYNAANYLIDDCFNGQAPSVEPYTQYTALVAGLEHGGRLGEYAIYDNWSQRVVGRRSR